MQHLIITKREENVAERKEEKAKIKTVRVKLRPTQKN
jgi:hypothetical protein